MSEDDDHEEEPRRRHLLPLPAPARPPRRAVHTRIVSRSTFRMFLSSPFDPYTAAAGAAVAEDRDCGINFSPTCNVTLEPNRWPAPARPPAKEGAFLIVFSLVVVVVGRLSDRPGRGDIGDGG